MMFLELESYIEPPHGFPEGPFFSSDLWPLILRRSDEVKSVLWFRHESPDHAGASHLSELGPFTMQSNQTIEMLKHRSFYGGHLNVMYVIQADGELLQELVRLYPRAGTIYSDSTNDLALTPAARFDLARFVESLPPDLLLLSFAHDADPAYIFGAHAALEKLQVTSVSFNSGF